MALPTVFISYNPNSDIDQTLAVRLHTIGAVHGFNMLLPDRVGFTKSVSNETKSRILSADYFILFSTEVLSPLLERVCNAFLLNPSLGVDSPTTSRCDQISDLSRLSLPI